MKVLFYVYDDTEASLVHLFLYLKELNRKKIEARMILDGKAAAILATLDSKPRSFTEKFFHARDNGWILGVCKACALMGNSVEGARKEFIPILEDLDGHAPMARFIEDGYTIVKF